MATKKPRSKASSKAPAIPPELSINNVDLSGKYVVLRERSMRPEYRGPDRVLERVLFCAGGFGCMPSAIGTGVFGHTPYSGESSEDDAKWHRGDIERLATEDEIKAATAKDLPDTPHTIEVELIFRKSFTVQAHGLGHARTVFKREINDKKRGIELVRTVKQADLVGYKALEIDGVHLWQQGETDEAND